MKNATSKADVYSTGLAAQAARLAYVERLTKQEIASIMGVSRFKVKRLIDLAHENGLVRIEVIASPDRVTELEDGLRERYGLRSATVVATHGAPSIAPALGHAASCFLASVLRPGDVLGIGWGSTVHATVVELARQRLPSSVDVVQVSGGVREIDPATNAIELASRAAETLHGHLYPIHAPAFVDTPAAREALIRQSSLAATFEAFPRLTVAVQGIGTFPPTPETGFYRAANLSDKDLALLYRRGALGDIFGHVFDRSGSFIAELSSRAITIPPEDIGRIPLRLGIAGGPRKLAAIRAVIAVRHINGLVTDAETAEQLMLDAPPESGSSSRPGETP